MPAPRGGDATDRADSIGPVNVSAPRNKLGITDYDELQRAERDITSYRSAELRESPVVGGFDLKHLQAIHKRLFSDVYQHAGKLRDESISKLHVVAGEQRLSSSFAPPQDIRNNARRVFNHVAADRQFKGTTDREFDQKLGRLYADINSLHPFKDGNGRTQREFLRQLALESGRELDFRHITAEQNDRASSAAHERGDNTGLRDIITAARTGRSLEKVVIPQPTTSDRSPADLRAALEFTAAAQKLYTAVEHTNRAFNARTQRPTPALSATERRVLVSYAEVLAARHAKEPLATPARNAQLVAGGLAVLDHPKDANPFRHPELHKIYNSQVDYNRRLEAERDRSTPTPELDR